MRKEGPNLEIKLTELFFWGGEVRTLGVPFGIFRIAWSFCPLPALRHGRITFACFNNLAKVNEDVVGQNLPTILEVPDDIFAQCLGSLGQRLRDGRVSLPAVQHADGLRTLPGENECEWCGHGMEGAWAPCGPRSRAVSSEIQ